MSIDVLTAFDYGVEAWMPSTYTVYLHFSAITGPHIIATFSSNKETYEKLQEIVRMAFILAFSPPTLLQEKYFEKGRDYGKYGFIHICHSIGFTVKTNEGYHHLHLCLACRIHESRLHHGLRSRTEGDERETIILGHHRRCSVNRVIDEIHASKE